MTTYESEIRYMIEDLDVFEKRLDELNAKLIYNYEFSDHYFKPKRISWNPLYKTIRIREWFKPTKGCEVLFNKVEIMNIDGLIFKRSVYPQGKIRILKGNLRLCKDFLNELEFEEWFSIEKKNCKLVEIPRYDFRTVYEYVSNLGWTGELETNGDDPEEVKRKLEEWIRILNIKKENVTYKPLSLIYGEKMGFL